MPLVLQDERLSSREAESLLARRLKNWRDRKPLLDAASAAVILQDYLDSRAPASPDTATAGRISRREAHANASFWRRLRSQSSARSRLERGATF